MPPVEPSSPANRRPHRDRIADIVRFCPSDPMTAGVCIDNTPEHIAYYLYQLEQHKEIVVLSQKEVNKDMYLIKITKVPIN